MSDCAGTSFTIFAYNTSATFPSRKIFRVIYAFSTPSNKIGNSFFVVLLCKVALQSSKYFAEQCNLSSNNQYRSRRFAPDEIHPWRNQLSISERGSYRIKRYKPRIDANSLANDLASYVLITAYSSPSRFSSHISIRTA